MSANMNPFANLGGPNHGNRQSNSSLYGSPYQPTYYRPGPIVPSLAQQQASLQAIYSAYAASIPTGVGPGPSKGVAVASTPPWPPAPKPKPTPHEGIRAGEVIGWRCWRIHNGFLRSVTSDAVWSPDVPMEGDIAKGLGIFAYKTEAELMTRGEGYWQTGAVAIGSIEMWGEIVEHERGYRAQFAAIKSIELVRGVGEATAQILSERYNLPHEPKHQHVKSLQEELKELNRMVRAPQMYGTLTTEPDEIHETARIWPLWVIPPSIAIFIIATAWAFS